MRRPTGVPDSALARLRSIRSQSAFDLGDFLGGFVHHVVVVLEIGDAAGILAAIFQTFESLDQDIFHGFWANVTDDSTHARVYLSN